MQKAQTKWIRPRHRIVQNIARCVLRPVCTWMYGIQAERFENEGNRPYLVLYNHQTAFDQFFVGLSFRHPIYYVATEDIFSKGLVSTLLRWLVAPIPIKKQTGDVGAVRNCLRVSREGGSICLAPEGNRTYSGRTEYINPAITTLARMLKLPIALYRIEGGYGIQPRWSDGRRKGSMRAFVSRVVEPEEYAALSDEELYEVIVSGLQVDDHAEAVSCLSQRRAEYLERAMYVCPDCGLSAFESHGNEVQCLKCRRTVTYGEDMKLTGVGFDFPYENAGQWYDAQKAFINELDVTQLVGQPVYEETADVYEVIVYKEKKLLRKETRLRLCGDKVTIALNDTQALVLPFDEISAATVLGRNKLNLYHKNQVYQVKGSKRFNALKYVHFCYRWKNKDKGGPDGKFLGL